MRPLIVAALCCTFLLVGCGGKSIKPEPEPAAPRTQTLDEVLAELANLEQPQGVDGATWVQLKQRFASALKASGKTKFTAAIAPANKSIVADLAVSGDTSSATFTWTYRNVADYDQNGEVNVSDLTPLGAHLFKTPASPDWQKAKLADGDNNGEVNISDITPIGANLLNSVNGYKLQYSADGSAAGTWTDVDEVPTSTGTVPVAGGAKTFTHLLSGAVAGWYRVRAYAGTVTGSISNSVNYVPGAAAARWNQHGGSARNTFLSALNGPATLPTETARVELMEQYGPPLYRAGLGLFNVDGAGNVRRFTEGGAEVWSLKLAGHVHYPYMALDGSLRVISAEGLGWAISPDGDILWEQDFGELFLVQEFTPDGTMICTKNEFDQQTFFFTDPVGVAGAEISTAPRYIQAIAPGPDGFAYVYTTPSSFSVESEAGRLTMYDSMGNVEWELDFPQFEDASGNSSEHLASDAQGNVYLYVTWHVFATDLASGYVFSYDPAGSERWTREEDFFGGYESRLQVQADRLLVPGQVDVFVSDDPTRITILDTTTGDTVDTVDTVGSIYNALLGPDGRVWWDDNGGFRSVVPGNAGSAWSYPDFIPLYTGVPGENNSLYWGSGELGKLSDAGMVEWEIGDKGIITGQPVIGTDGTIYVGRGTRLQALDSNLQVLWTTPQPATEMYTRGSPVVLSDGNIVQSYGDLSITPKGGMVVCYTPAGAEVWRSEYTDSRPTQPRTGVDGRIYVADTAPRAFTSYLRALSTVDGSEDWTYELPGPVERFRTVTIAVLTEAGGDRIYVGTASLPNATLVCIDGEGAEVYTYDTGWPQSSIVRGFYSVAVLPDGSALAISFSGDELIRVDPAGELDWTHAPGTILQGVGVAANGHIAVHSTYDLALLDSTGAVQWTQPTGNPPPPDNYLVDYEYTQGSSPVFDPAGRVYARSDHSMRCYSLAGDLEWELPLLAHGGDEASPLISAPGELLVLQGNGVLVQFKQ
jgi:hypothetical protein